MIRGIWCLSVGAAVVMLVACGNRPEQYALPDQVMDFGILYKDNCAGCHGQNGRHGAARPLNDPLYLALAGKGKLRNVIAKGVPRTSMPAFAINAGGTLTDQQVAILADQIEARWSQPREFAGVALPPYSADLGDREHGKAVFVVYCSRCHGDGGTPGSKGGPVVNPAYLALVSDQSLRTTVIAGRADQDIPNWRTYTPGHPMTPPEISDVVAWLSAQRKLPEN